MDEKLKRELYDKLMDKFDSLHSDLQNFVQENTEDLSEKSQGNYDATCLMKKVKHFMTFDSCTMGLDEVLDNVISEKIIKILIKYN